MTLIKFATTTNTRGGGGGGKEEVEEEGDDGGSGERDVTGVVVHSGGDLMKWSPAEHWQVQKYFEYSPAEEEALAAFAFDPESLCQGEEAERRVRRFSPGLAGRGAVVVRGTMRVQNLPLYML